MSRILHANVGVVDPVFPYVPNDFGFPSDGNTTPFLRNLTCKIAGIDRSGYVKADSLSGTLQLEGRDDLSLELIDLTDSYRPLLAEPVEVTSNANLLFRGTIVDIQERYEIAEAERVRYISVRCSGAGHALDRRLVFGDIPGNDLYAVLIQILQPSGIHSDLWGFYDFAPFPGPAIEAQRVNGSTALQYVQRAVNSAGDGWTWWLDWNGNYPQLHVRDLSSDPIDAPWDATDSSGNILAVEGVDYDDSEYANRVYVRMGSEAVSTVTEQFIGGTFAEDIYQLDYVPLEILSITVNGDAQTFGVKSELWDTGDDTSLQWYYQPIGVAAWFANTLWGGPEQSLVASGAIIEVKYRAQTGSYVRADDAAEQAARAALMGFGSGIVEKILELKDIADATAAQQYADAMLAKLKTVPTVVRYTTFRHGLKPGQTQTITLSKHDINGEYNISSVRFREVASSYEGSEVGIEYAIEATSGTRAVPHPLRLHEDIIDAVRGAQEAARSSNGPSEFNGGAGGGLPNWEIPRDSGDGLTFFVNEPFDTTVRNPYNLIAFASKRKYNPHEGDYTVDGPAGSFTFASGMQPIDAAEKATLNVIYWPKSSLPISNPALGARHFAGGTDVIDYGTDATFNITGNVSGGVWFKPESGSISNGQIIGYGIATAGASHAWILMVNGSSDNWHIRYGHDDTAESPSSSAVFEGYTLENDRWYYVGFSRFDAIKNVRIWIGDGEKLLYTSAFTYLFSAASAGAGSKLQVGNCPSATSGTQPATFVGTIQEHYVWERTTNWDDDHLPAMIGNPPTNDLILSVRVLGNEPEQDESATGAGGAVTGTTEVAGH